VRAVDSVEPGAGYATSKWACEVLLEEMHRRYGLSVAIVRCGNIAPHRAYPSALNWADNTNRLLASIVETGLAPESFYTAAGGRYDLVPLDAAVPAIATIAMSLRGLSTVHITSDDEVSLDSLVAWVESSGVAIRRLPYDQWFAAWSERLAALPAERRARSAFVTLDRWRTPAAVGGVRLDTTSYRALRTSIVDEALVHRWVAALRAQ
jgi:fatty acid CoA ligase FadD9